MTDRGRESNDEKNRNENILVVNVNVNVDILLVLGTTAIVFVDASLNTLRDLGSVVGEASSVPFFPYAAPLKVLLLDFYLTGDLGLLLCGSVTAVRRREDTDGNRDAGVKVQIAFCRALLLSSRATAHKVKKNLTLVKGSKRSGKE